MTQIGKFDGWLKMKPNRLYRAAFHGYDSLVADLDFLDNSRFPAPYVNVNQGDIVLCLGHVTKKGTDYFKVYHLKSHAVGWVEDPRLTDYKEIVIDED